MNNEEQIRLLAEALDDSVARKPCISDEASQRVFQRIVDALS